MIGVCRRFFGQNMIMTKATEVCFVKKKILWGVGIAAFVGAGVLIWMLDFPSWKKLDMEKLTALSQTTIVYDAQGCEAAGLHSGENRTVVPLEAIPEYVRNAFIAIEDARFYEHCGIDIRRIGGALLNNIKAGGYEEGASTITQQLIKLTHLTSEKKLSRKAQEAWLAIQLERRVEKDEILEMYLNVVYFGRGAYGIEAASRAYFGKSCSELTLSEGAMLAAVIKAPSRYAPHINAERAKERRNLVLNAMVREEMISRETADMAAREEIVLVNASASSGGWYIDGVLREAEHILGCGREELLGGGYRIYTSLNQQMQTEAQRLFEDDSYFPSAADDGIRPESALIAVNPENGEIYCMVGGRSYDTRLGLNRATQMKRQPGSAFKPISVYAAAIDFLGYTPVSMLEDRVRDFGGGYSPSNASGKEYGTVTLRQALTKSMNLATMDLMTRTGIEPARMYAQRAGIELSDSDNNLSLALGSLTEGVSPAQLSAAYAPLVNGGHRVRAHTVRRIEDLYGRVLYEYQAENEYVMSEESACMLTSVLQDVVQNGTAKQLRAVNFPVAAKTGTVGYAGGGNRDAWTVAYTPTVTLAVWQGYDRPDAQHVLPEGTTGGTYPAKLAAAFLNATSSVSDGGEFEIPREMNEVLLDGSTIDSPSGMMLASENTPSKYLVSEILPEGRQPMMTSDRWDYPKQVEVVYAHTEAASGYPAVSFIVPDSHAQYRIIRIENEKETEVGTMEGNAGRYVTFVDTQAPRDANAAYYVVSRHKGFYELGRIVESQPSETAQYRAPAMLERFLEREQDDSDGNESALFAVSG